MSSAAEAVDAPVGRVATIPEGSVLVHVGPHKTGTTALQRAMWAARDDLRAQGVRVAGRSPNAAAAARAVTNRPTPYADDGRRAKASHWDRLAREIRGAREPRVVVSSEMFSWATDEHVARIARELGPGRVRIAVTLRPLARVMPSMWQQNVQAGSTAPFEAWLRTVLDQPSARPAVAFWTLHRHDELLRRWASVIGADRVVAIVVDDRDHHLVLRAFEGLLGVRDGTLAPQADAMNRSLTWPEVEAVRAFNTAFETERLRRATHARLMRFGASQLMKRRQPSADEARIGLPAWAAERVARVQAEVVEGIRASGVTIVGDPDRLAEPADVAGGTADPPTSVSPEIAAAMAMGIVIASGEARRDDAAGGRFHAAEPVELARIPTYQVGRVLVSRGIRGVTRRIGRLRGRIG